MSQDIAHKLASLLEAMDWNRPELSGVRQAADPAAALLAALARPPRGRYRFEYQRKAQMLTYLREHYASWRQFDTTAAEKIASLTLEQARGPRATMGIAALGQAWLATGDARYGQAFERFYLQSATGQMFNFDDFNGSQGALELPAYFLLLDCPGFSQAGRIAFLDHLQAICADAWDQRTSRWWQVGLSSEGHNWYLHGIQVLPWMGVLFPEFKRADFFLRSAWSVVEEHVRGHYKSDGGARETTLGYQCGSLRSLWDFYVLARRNGWPMSQGMAERLLQATHFVLSLMTPAATMPSFGDTWTHDVGLAELAAIAAAITGDGRCKWYALAAMTRGPRASVDSPQRIPLGAFWAVGLEGAWAYEHVRAEAPTRVSVLMGPTGYVAMRDSHESQAAYMAVAAADRGSIVTSHGHNEILSLEVHGQGVRWLGSPGPAPYGATPGRDFDQATQAHNCLSIVGMEQTPILNEWRWAKLVTPAVRRWISEPTHDYLHAVHEGFYTHGRQDTLHARKVFFVKSGTGVLTGPSYWIVLDWVESLQENDYRIDWHAAAPGRIQGQNILLEQDEERRLAIIPSTASQLKLVEAASAGLEAYRREKGLDAAGNPSFTYTCRGRSICVAWVMVPLQSGQALPKVEGLAVRVNGQEADAHDALALAVTFPGHKDQLCVSHKDFDAELEVGERRDWGHVAFARVTEGESTVFEVAHTMDQGVCGR